MPPRTHKAPEVFIDHVSRPLHGKVYTPTGPIFTNYIRVQNVPRLFKPALGGYASLQAQGWPPDQSSGTRMAITPHPAIVLTIPDKRSGLTRGGDALRASSMDRIPPVLVRTRSR